MMADFAGRTLVDLSGDVRSGKILAADWVRFCLARIAESNDTLTAFLAVDDQAAIQNAEAVDARIRRGDKVGPLAGVPVAIKDNISTAGILTTCASRMLERYRPAFDATVVERLKAADAIVLGKTNMDEFAMGSTSSSSAFGPVRNPWDRERTPGGSSGGSAAAVAAGMAAAAIGSDTGGSIRQPAAWCGISGIKPTWGRVSRHGLVAYANSLDQIGPMARSAGDLATILSMISGSDQHDATCQQKPELVPSGLLNVNTRELRIGWLPSQFENGAAGDANLPVRKAIDEIGGECRGMVELHSRYQSVLCGVYYIIAMSQASSNLGRFDGVRFTARFADNADPGDASDQLDAMYRQTRGTGFGREVRRRILLGTFALSAGAYDQFFSQASKVRRLVRDELLDMFRDVDVILSPVTVGPPPKLGEKVDRLRSYRADSFTVAANLAGLPAMSVPCGMTDEGLPVGIQMIAAPWREDLLLSLGQRWQQMTDWHLRRPS